MAPATLPTPPQKPALPEQFDRFKIVKVLGEGAQGIVYQAFDPHLERQVAIKAIKQNNDQPTVGGEHADGLNASEMQILLREARTVSKFQHPNIVSIYEIGYIAEAPYLVLEFVDGPLLSGIIKACKAGVPPKDFFTLASQILEGLSFAHDNGFIHGDLKPANILVTKTKIAKITDFGIARAIGEKSGDAMTGSPRYMAPEYITERLNSPASDQFAMGIIFYQLLTGKQPVTGKTLEAIFAQITAAKFPAPSSINSSIDPKLDAIIAKALALNPQQRFANVSELNSALQEFDNQRQADATMARTPPTVDSLRKLRQKIRDQKDFPSLSSSITNLNGLFAGSEKNADSIAAVITKDVALTSKVMRIANSAYVPHAGGEISSLSHAVMMLGFPAIREIAASLMMIDMLKGDEDSAAVKEQLVRSLFSATLARRIATREGEQEIESCFLVGMFYRFGKLLVCFHLAEDHQKIEQLVKKGKPEEAATREVLGYSYTEIGHEIAEDWALPKFLVDSVQAVPLDQQPDKPVTKAAVFGAFSCDITDLMATVGPSSLRTQLSRLSVRYMKLIELSGDEIEAAMDASRVEFLKYCKILKINTKDSGIDSCLQNWEQYFPDELQQSDEQTEFSSAHTQTAPRIKGNASAEDQTNPGDQTGPPSSSKISVALLRGIQEIRKLLQSGDYDFDDLIRKILATVYYGVDCRRVLLCRCLEPQNKVKARYAVGKQVNHLLKQFQFPLNANNGVFSRAIDSGDDVIIGDLATHAILEPLPLWYKQIGAAGSFAVFPFQTKGKTQGFIYADHADPHYMDNLPPTQLKLVGNLRDLCGEAYRIRHRQMQQQAAEKA